jgi:hypothetical protein
MARFPARGFSMKKSPEQARGLLPGLSADGQFAAALLPRPVPPISALNTCVSSVEHWCRGWS